MTPEKTTIEGNGHEYIELDPEAWTEYEETHVMCRDCGELVAIEPNKDYQQGKDGHTCPKAIVTPGVSA